MWEKDDLKFVIEDARHRQSALLQLIYFNDQQALELLKLYVTIGLAAATGAGARFLGSSAIPIGVALALAFAVVALFVGCVFCLRAMRLETVELALPGRGANFWSTAIMHDSLMESGAVSKYLDELSEQQEADHQTNTKAAKEVMRAKWSSVAALGIAMIVLIISYWFA